VQFDSQICPDTRGSETPTREVPLPPLPPHITAKQAKAFMAAFMKGDRELAGVMKHSTKQVIHEA
jgi:hypothetical protein